MLTLDVSRFMRLLAVLFHVDQVYRIKTGPIPQELVANQPKLATELHVLCQELRLPVSAEITGLLATCETGEDVTAAATTFHFTLDSEIKQRKFYAVSPERAAYFEPPQLFGLEVFTNFPSANDDIFEAGTCLALERGTACVMHLMRVAEAGLKVLAAALGVGPQNNWASYLSQIEKELEKRYKASGARTPNEQFYSEVRVTFDAIRRAWRNPSMHVEKTYSLERAEEILIAVRSFMQHLATKLHK